MRREGFKPSPNQRCLLLLCHGDVAFPLRWLVACLQGLLDRTAGEQLRRKRMLFVPSLGATWSIRNKFSLLVRRPGAGPRALKPHGGTRRRQLPYWGVAKREGSGF